MFKPKNYKSFNNFSLSLLNNKNAHRCLLQLIIFLYINVVIVVQYMDLYNVHHRNTI